MPNFSYETVLNVISEMRVPILLVRALCDDKDPEHTPYDFIITADGKQRVIIHTFLVDDGGESRMCSLYSRDMSFMDAVMHYSKLVLNDPLSNLQLLSY